MRTSENAETVRWLSSDAWRHCTVIVSIFVWEGEGMEHAILSIQPKPLMVLRLADERKLASGRLTPSS